MQRRTPTNRDTLDTSHTKSMISYVSYTADSRHIFEHNKTTKNHEPHQIKDDSFSIFPNAVLGIPNIPETCSMICASPFCHFSISTFGLRSYVFFK